MSWKQIIIAGYLGMGLIVGIYQSQWGNDAYKGMAYNLGKGLVWPAVLFPIVGQIVGVVLLLAVIAWLLLKK